MIAGALRALVIAILGATAAARPALASPGFLGGLDNFVLYKVRSSPAGQPLVAFGPVELSDRFGVHAYSVLVPKQLGLPADSNRVES